MYGPATQSAAQSACLPTWFSAVPVGPSFLRRRRAAVVTHYWWPNNKRILFSPDRSGVPARTAKLVLPSIATIATETLAGLDLSQCIELDAPSKISKITLATPKVRCTDAPRTLSVMCRVPSNRALAEIRWSTDERRQWSSLHLPRMWTTGNTTRIRGPNQRRRIRIKVQTRAESQGMPEPQRSSLYCSAICRYTRTLLNDLACDRTLI
jgi:hypothetical protein